jgi:biotin operon repressor
MLLDSTFLVSVSLSHQQPSQAQSARSNAAPPLALLANPAGEWSFGAGQYLSANLSTRGEIVAYILTNPGVYLREIGEDLGLSMGVVQYHVWVLTTNGEVQECRSGRYRRFFGAARYDEQERVVISLLRQGTTGRILAALSGDQALTHMKLAALLGVTSQALTWQMKRLKEMGMVETFEIQSQSVKGYRLANGISRVVDAIIHQTPRAEPKLIQVPAVH